MLQDFHKELKPVAEQTRENISNAVAIVSSSSDEDNDRGNHKVKSNGNQDGNISNSDAEVWKVKQILHIVIVISHTIMFFFRKQLLLTRKPHHWLTKLEILAALIICPSSPPLQPSIRPPLERLEARQEVRTRLEVSKKKLLPELSNELLHHKRLWRPATSCRRTLLPHQPQLFLQKRKKTRKQAKQLAKQPKKSNTVAADPSAGSSTELDF